MPRDVPELTGSQREAIQTTLVRWAEVHPRPDMPIIQLADGSELTPREIARVIRDPESGRGQFLYRVFAAGLIEDQVEGPESLENILGNFRRDTELWQPARSQ